MTRLDKIFFHVGQYAALVGCLRSDYCSCSAGIGTCRRGDGTYVFYYQVEPIGHSEATACYYLTAAAFWFFMFLFSRFAFCVVLPLEERMSKLEAKATADLVADESEAQKRVPGIDRLQQSLDRKRGGG